jgi:hypothetical protein
MTPEDFWKSTPHEIYAGFMALDSKKWNAAEDGGQENMTKTLAEIYEREEDERRARKAVANDG